MLAKLCRRNAALLSGVSAAIFLSMPSYADGHKTDEAKTHKAFTECVAVRMKEINIDHLEKFNPDKHATKVPAGWTVISGTGGEGHPKLLLCR